MLPALASVSHKMADTLPQRQGRRYRSSSEGEYQETHLATRESFGNCRRTWQSCSHRESDLRRKRNCAPDTTHCTPWGTIWRKRAHWIKRLIQCLKISTTTTRYNVELWLLTTQHCLLWIMFIFQLMPGYLPISKIIANNNFGASVKLPQLGIFHSLA